jgi:hypothetical protein
MRFLCLAVYSIPVTLMRAASARDLWISSGRSARTHYGLLICRQKPKAHTKESVEPLRVVLIKHKLVLPDDGPRGPKHVGVILMYSLL